MLKRAPYLVMAIICFAVSCDEDEKNPLAGTKWLDNSDGTAEYVYFHSNTFDDYFYDDEFLCYDYIRGMPYSVSGNTLRVLEEKITFIKTDETLTLINPVEQDTIVFMASDFDPDTFDLCGIGKTIKKGFLHK